MTTPTNAIVIHTHGAPEVLHFEPTALPPLGPDEIRLRHTSIGVNFHDIYVRSGSYKTLTLPGIPGMEAAGVILEVGAAVQGLVAGDRVCYATPRYGAYSEERVLPASIAVKLPDSVDDLAAGSIFVKGLTATILVHRVYPVKQGTKVLVHAAAGGVGRLLCQWARALGATVIGTVGSAKKAELATGFGCHHVIDYNRENFAERVREITQGAGVDVVYDSVGKATFQGSLACLATLGHLVNFGQSSGPVEPLAVSQLSAGSNTLVRPMFYHYVQQRSELERYAGMLFDALSSGVLSPGELVRYPLRDAAQAHRDLESRALAGFPILVP